jgi:glutamine synthetase
VAVTESLDYMATQLEAAVGKGKKSLEAAVKELLPKVIKDNKRIIFNGNNYADEWRKEAAKRGLLNLANTVDALPELVKPDVVKMFEKYKVLNAREIGARTEINFETYIKTINVEAQLMVLMANRYILPAILEYQKDVAESVAAVKAAGGAVREAKRMLDRITGLVDDLRAATEKLIKVVDHHASGGSDKHAKYMRDTVVPAMAALREIGDQIEVIVPHAVWPLPTYREMLFVK